MSKRTTTPTRVRTAAAIKADAVLLAGHQPRLAVAAADAAAAPEETGSVGELWLYGVVGGWWRGFDAESVSTALRDLDVDTLYVRIHSPGGHASDGVAISNLLRNHKAHVVVVVDGLAASAASVIAIAGDEVVMCPGSQMMLHDAAMATWGNAAQLHRDADWINGQSDNYAGVYALKAGGTPGAWRAVMLANEGEGTWYTADEAVTAGLADSVGTRTAVGSPPTSPVEQLDELDDDDEMLARVEHDLALLEHEIHPAARAAWNGERPKPPTASADGSITTQEGRPAMAFTPEQLTTMRQELGLAEDADEATIVAALSEALAEQAEDPASPTTPTFTPPAGFSLVDDATLATLRAGAEDGREARTQQRTEDRDRTIAAAIHDGRIPKARQEHYEAAWTADPDGTKQLLASLAPGLVPVEERGHNEGTATGGVYDELYGNQKGA